jgi:hypothetical protein
LDENDAIWEKTKTWHISRVMEYVTEKFKEFKNENKAAQFELQKDTNVKPQGSKIDALKEVLSSFDEYQNTKNMVALHMEMCLLLSKRFKQLDLEPFVDLEQFFSVEYVKGVKNNKFDILIKLLSDPKKE